MIEQPRRIGKMRKFAAVGVAALALTGCAEGTPQRNPSNQAPILDCESTPRDTRKFPIYSLNLNRCIERGTTSDTQAVTIVRNADDAPIGSFVAIPFRGGNDTYSRQGELFANPTTGECVIVSFKTEGYTFIDAAADSCSVTPTQSTTPPLKA